MIFFTFDKKTFKAEGTSKAFGQSVKIKKTNESTIEESHIDNEKVDQSISVGSTIVEVNQVSGQIDINQNSTKSQIALAAASNDSSAVIAIGSQEGPNQDGVGALFNINKISAIVENSISKSKDEIKNILLESQKIDLPIAMKSKNSDSIEFNGLKVPNLNIEFFYQFFTEDETDVTKQEDQSSDPLLNSDIRSVPRFVEIIWNRSMVSEKQTNVKIDKSKNATVLKQKSFTDAKGLSNLASSNFKNSFAKSLKSSNLIKSFNIPTKIIDIHDLPKAFNSISNDRVFTNTVVVSIDVSKTDTLGSIGSLLLKTLKK